MKLLIITLLSFYVQETSAQESKNFIHSNNKQFIDSIIRKRDTVKVVLLTSDTTSYSKYVKTLNIATWQYGYSVREQHSTAEGVYDPYFQYGFKAENYWEHLYYIDSQKREFGKNIIIWQSKSL